MITIMRLIKAAIFPGMILRADFYQFSYNTKVVPVYTAEHGLSKASRPNNGSLDKLNLIREGFISLPT